jgi:hypothetical protein
MSEKKKYVAVNCKFIEKKTVAGVDYLVCESGTEGVPEIYFPCTVAKVDAKGKVTVESSFLKTGL